MSNGLGVKAHEGIHSFRVKELLADTCRYLVPMYQRNYAWGEGEINQLIQDVQDYQQHKPDQPYYIGTLVIFERPDGQFEVIDGQQRFTTLTLLAFALKRIAEGKVSVNSKHPAPQSIDMSWYNEPNLDFESRQKSSDTFAALKQGVALEHLKNDAFNLDVVEGYHLLEKGLLALGNKLSEFCDYLFNQVEIARVSVPKDTDLNHYFEVMNNRGEQLEKHEVVKARLMSVLNDIEDKDEREQSIDVLAKVWDATANMERYIQYGFSKAERHALFGTNDWGQFTPQRFEDVKNIIASGEQPTDNSVSAGVAIRLCDMLVNPPSTKSRGDAELTPERFNSVINFSNFLLHVLKVSTQQDVALDDKRLLEQFEQYLLKKDLLDKQARIEAVKAFVFALLKSKYLFDQYIIKREFAQGEDKWSLKRLHFYNDKSQSYINTFDSNANYGSEDGFEGINRRILMLLSALHVSTPTLVYKHWLNGALYQLYYMDEISPAVYLEKLEHLARQFVFGRFLQPEGSEYFAMIYQGAGYRSLDTDDQSVMDLLRYGEIENNLVFNYLDYLLWCYGMENGADAVINQFEFSFRSSVEHFYPQHPLDGHKKLDNSELHRFGNLCLISHSKNSKLSNVQPSAKRDHFKAAINDKNIDTLKLYEMILHLNNSGEWGEKQILEHEQKMIEILKKDSKTGVNI
ncbi:DUF262 domain-containing protein [Photobacterium leiognathi]|uniref:DUF262 domain-containing protein n=1 Tax=Photobacterium leiognathi TaxID=553611 RepID=UPI002738538E|nr:DUF262 domain-containing HNH endonuclease family protein [Photobacterium leiognathi]